MGYDFCGYATKSNVRCKDGRTILKDAFKHQDGAQVPLVWQHGHGDNLNVIGHAILENRDDGVYAYGYLNDTERGKAAKEQILHGDYDSMSIFAGDLNEFNGFVSHGEIYEVSLCLGGANKEALIENVTVMHSDGASELSEDEAIMHFNDVFKIDGSNEFSHSSGSVEKTMQDVLDSMNEDQKDLFYGMIGEALKMKNDKGGEKLKHNVFDTNREKTKGNTFNNGHITHDQFVTIRNEAQECGSWRKAFLAHANEYGIGNIEYLFPEAKMINDKPEFLKRDTGWVAGVLNSVKKLPFSRIKTIHADITTDEARAKGYIKGTLKKEEFFELAKREVGPITVYKKQKLDRDDIIDAEMDVVNWLWGEMRLMFDEELARAILIGDGRETDDPDKIKDSGPYCIRSVWNDHDLYTIHVDVDAEDAEAELEAILQAMEDYDGTGTPSMYVPKKKLVRWKLIKDKNGRRIYNTAQEIADFLGVKEIVEVDAMKGATRTTDAGNKKELSALIVNLADYRLGTDRGGEITKFDQFDIDYNQHKYLIESRLSGTLAKLKSAIAIEKTVV